MTRKLKKVIVPPRYKGHPLATCIWKNLNQFIRYAYDEDYNAFFAEYKARLIAQDITARTAKGDQPQKKVDHLKQCYVDTPKATKKLSAKQADYIGKVFGFVKEGLKTPRKIKSTVYVLVKSKGEDAGKLVRLVRDKPDDFSNVDEVTLITGDYSVYLRLHGTVDEIEKFLTSDIYSIKGIEIQGTSTITPIGNTYYQRYPPKEHANYRYRKPAFVK